MQTSQMTRDDWAKMTIKECEDFALAYMQDAIQPATKATPGDKENFAARLAYRAYEAAHAVTVAYATYRHDVESAKKDAELVLERMDAAGGPDGQVRRAWGYDPRAAFEKLEAAGYAKRDEWNLFYAYVTERDAHTAGTAEGACPTCGGIPCR